MLNGSQPSQHFILEEKLDHPSQLQTINQKLQTISLPIPIIISTKISQDTSPLSLKKQSGRIQIQLSQKTSSIIALSQTKKKHFSHNGSEKKKNSAIYKPVRGIMLSEPVKIHAVNHGKLLKKTFERGNYLLLWRYHQLQVSLWGPS